MDMINFDHKKKQHPFFWVGNKVENKRGEKRKKKKKEKRMIIIIINSKRPFSDVRTNSLWAFLLFFYFFFVFLFFKD